MKKVMILLVIALAANVMMAQDRDYQDAIIYLRQNNLSKAMTSIEKSVNHENFLGMKVNKQAKAWLCRATIYQNILQSDDEALIAQAPNALEYVYESLMNCMKNPEFLEENKQEIYQRVGAVMSIYYNKGFDLYNAHNFAEAAPMFKKAYDISKSLGSPEANDMLNAAAQSSLFSQDYTTALTYFNELKDNGMENADIYKHLAACYNGLGNNEQYLAMINAGLEKYPSDANLILEKVNTYLKEGKGAEAVEDLNKLRELDPDNAQLLFALGTIYGNSENESIYDADKAIEYYQDAIRVNPDYYDATYNLGVLYTDMANKYIKQANEITGISKAELEQYNSLIEQANELLRTGLPYLKKVYETQPSDDVKNVLRSIYVQLKMNDELKALMSE